MAKLSVYLPPFAPDYSGASSVLFDLNAVTAMHDASGCTGNYTGYDEPRWYGSKSAVFCSGLREIDAVLGDDEKLIEKMLAAAEDLKPDIMALVGSPVPMVIGCDLKGIANELEYRSEIPSFGFDMTGTEYYDAGIAAAMKMLLNRFGEKRETIAESVNIVGANPMDFGVSANVDDLKSVLLAAGFQINACLSMDYNLEQIRNAPNAQINLAVSRAGVMIADMMEAKYGIPYLAGMPLGEKAAAEFGGRIQEVAETGISVSLKGEPCEQARILVLGEQVFGNSFRHALDSEFGIGGVACGCIFEMDRQLALVQDRDLFNEKKIIEAVNDPQYQVVVGDPIFRTVLRDQSKLFIDNPHYGISSKLGIDRTVNYIGTLFNEWMKEQKGLTGL